MNRRVLAEALGADLSEITMAMEHGYVFKYGSLTTYHHYIQWKVDHPEIDLRALVLESKRWRNVPVGIRRFVFERDGFGCHYCGSQGRLSLDHIIPFSKGGSHEPENLLTACLPCNVRRKTTPYEEFRASVKFCVFPRITDSGMSWFQRRARASEPTLAQLQKAILRIPLPALR